MAVKTRLKIEAALVHFNKEILRLINFNVTNQARFNAGQLNQNQIDLLVESIFFNCFRYYENYIREAFLLCCLGKVFKRPRVRSYLNPKNFQHSEALIKSTSRYLDWSSPDSLIQRAEIYLENGHPISNIINGRIIQLRTFKKLRNHVAHDSIESLNEYRQVLTAYHGFVPVNIPTVGQFLMQASLITPGHNLLEDFFSVIQDVASDLAA
jgi:hypothetical protein